MATAMSISTANRLSYSLAGAPELGTLGEGYETSVSRTVSNGTASNQANAAWAELVTVPAGQVLSLDLTNLAAEKFNFAGYVSFSVVKDVMVVNKETVAGRYVLWGVSSPSDTTGYAARINRSGDYRWSDYADGVTLTAGNKTIYVANPGAAAVLLEVAICGVGTYIDN
jgi:hypothetical protein